MTVKQVLPKEKLIALRLMGIKPKCYNCKHFRAYLYSSSAECTIRKDLGNFYKDACPEFVPRSQKGKSGQ